MRHFITLDFFFTAWSQTSDSLCRVPPTSTAVSQTLHKFPDSDLFTRGSSGRPPAASQRERFHGAPDLFHAVKVKRKTKTKTTSHGSFRSLVTLTLPSSGALTLLFEGCSGQEAAHLKSG